MNKEKLINKLSNASVEEDIWSDNLTIVLASYFERHEGRPKDDPIDTELGYGVWVIEKTEEAIEYITEQITESDIYYAVKPDSVKFDLGYKNETVAIFKYKGHAEQFARERWKEHHIIEEVKII